MRYFRTAVLVAGMLVPLAVLGQYPGQVAKKSKNAPGLRAIAVLEWTGEAGKPKACRIVPVTIYDGDKLHDAGIYMARPEPLALAEEVEYELKENGKTVGLFEVANSGQEQGSWVGYGKWKALPAVKPKVAAPPKIDDVEDDKPVLHRKQHAGEATGAGSKTGGSSAGSSQPASDDPDRPKLHKPEEDKGRATTAGNEPAPDPDRPKLEKKPETSKTTAPDPEGPTLQKARPQLAQNIGDVSSVDTSDPDRPKLKRGISTGGGPVVVPTLMGLPPDMQQAVAISDAKNRPDHEWTYSWANPDDENKMRAKLEDIARKALGLETAAPEPPPVPKKTAVGGRKTVKSVAAAAATPAPLGDEQFRVFELEYGSGATMVLTAHNDAPAASRKFVTIIAQPDLYGNVLVLLTSVTDMAHLDDTPRMRLVDAVDAMADNRGELLFELRGEGSRQLRCTGSFAAGPKSCLSPGAGFTGRWAATDANGRVGHTEATTLDGVQLIEKRPHKYSYFWRTAGHF